MQIRYVPEIAAGSLLEPGAPLWRTARAEPVKLIGTPFALQPTAAIRAAWANKPTGSVVRVDVAAVHDGKTVAFRLEWSDAKEDRTIGDTTAFPDAAAILLPTVPDAPAITMGAPGMAVNAWYWRADEDGSGRDVVAEGLGTTRTADLNLVRGHGVWKSGRWSVVIARAMRVQSTEPVVQLEPGQKTSYAVAVWEGSHGERAGIKAFSVNWIECRLDGIPTARR